MTTSHWVVARTKPSREKWAAENLNRQGYHHYLPITTSEQRFKRGQRVVPHHVPLFASYIFVQVQDQWHSILGTFGIASLLMSGSHPSYMPDQEINRIRQLEDERGVVKLQPLMEINKTQIRLLNGPMEGQIGLYQGQDQRERVKVLLDFLGGKRSILVANNAYEVV